MGNHRVTDHLIHHKRHGTGISAAVMGVRGLTKSHQRLLGLYRSEPAVEPGLLQSLQPGRELTTCNKVPPEKRIGLWPDLEGLSHTLS